MEALMPMSMSFSGYLAKSFYFQCVSNLYEFYFPLSSWLRLLGTFKVLKNPLRFKLI